MNGQIQPHQTSRFCKIIKVSIIAFCFTFIGAAIGLLLISRLFSEGLFTPWKALGSPPEPAEKIVSAHINMVEVQAASGNIYAFHPNALSVKWVQVESSTPNDPHLVEFEASLARPLRQKVKDQIAFTYKPEFFFDVQYAITEEGMVYQWEGPGGIDAVIYGTFYGIFGGFCIGIIVGIWLSTLPLRKGSKKLSGSKNPYSANFRPYSNDKS